MRTGAKGVEGLLVVAVVLGMASPVSAEGQPCPAGEPAGSRLTMDDGIWWLDARQSRLPKIEIRTLGSWFTVAASSHRYAGHVYEDDLQRRPGEWLDLGGGYASKDWGIVLWIGPVSWRWIESETKQLPDSGYQACWDGSRVFLRRTPEGD